MSERDDPLEDLLRRARRLPPEERAELLAEECPDESTRRRLASLLASESETLAEPGRSPAGIEVGPGSTITHYRILERLGEGGMGEVWLARDETLNRSVALKFPVKGSLEDPSARRRFLREARSAAALKHPAVCQIFELGRAGDRDFIVMEHVEGETLERSLDRGPVPIDQALEWGTAIAAALEEAHDKGIVHRDLKPANVMVTPADEVKVMDFGLARLLAGRGEVDREEETVTARLTASGMVVGTPGYMAPEQIRGEEVTEQTDVWALGGLLYRMLTGDRAFQGGTAAESMAAILEREPSWEGLPPETPVEVRLLLERCLRKDPRRRLRHVGDARIVLEDAIGGGEEMATPGLSGESSSPRTTRWALVAVAVGALLVGLLVGFLVLWEERTDPGSGSSIRFTLTVEAFDPGGALEENLAVHPHGTGWVYRARDDEGARLWFRHLDREEATSIPGTEGAENPFWSPGGEALGFVVDGAIRRVDPLAGSPRTVVTLPGGSVAGTPSWGDDDLILFALHASESPGVYRVAAEGGEPKRILGPEEVPGAPVLIWPRHIPGSDRFLVFGGGVEGRHRVFVASTGGEVIPLSEVSSRAEFVEPGILLFERDGALLAQPFDVDRARLEGEPRVVVESLARNPPTGMAVFDASPTLLVTGDRVFRARAEWFDRRGRTLGRVGQEGDVSAVRVSPEGDRVALAGARTRGGAEDLWIVELDRGVMSPVATTPSAEYRAVWSPDGTRLAYASDAAGPPDIRIRPADGGSDESTLVGGPAATFPLDWSPDGEEILYFTYAGAGLWLAPLDGSGPRPWLEASERQDRARYSPSGRWIAFRSTELGKGEIFVAPADDPARRRRISVGGGEHLAWSPAGDELFFTFDRELLAVGMDPGTGRPRGRASPLFRIDPPGRIVDLDVHPDGERFLLLIVDEDRLRPTTTIQLGWQQALTPT